MAPNKPEIRTAYSPRYDGDDIADFEPTKTQQHFAEECDINVIMKNYITTGLLPPGTTRMAEYDDFSQVDDYLQALLTIETARNQFNELPSDIRQRFNNDPAELLDFVHNTDNREEAQRLGLLTGTQATTGGVTSPAAAKPAAPPPTSPPAPQTGNG